MTDAAPSARRARATLLAPFSGEKPPAPDWFADALAATPERSALTVDGAAIETLAWGARGDRGLLFLHGNGAHADWWDFIAPSFANRFRVAALSWSGMGRSDWREDYSIDQHVDEAVAAGGEAGVFDHASKPLVVAHSFGSLPALRLAERMPDRLAGMVIVDPPLFSEATRAGRSRSLSHPPDLSEPRRSARALSLRARAALRKSLHRRSHRPARAQTGRGRVDVAVRSAPLAPWHPQA